MNLPLDSDLYSSSLGDCVPVQDLQTFESTTQAVPIVETSGKKRKLSSENSTKDENATDSHQEVTNEKFFIPVISESGHPLYHLPVVTVEEFPQDSRPAKKVMDEKELKSLRIRVAMLSDIDGDR